MTDQLERARAYLRKHAIARYVPGGSPGEGVVVAYSGSPMVLIEQADGSKFWWDVSLCTFSADRVAPETQEAAARFSAQVDEFAAQADRLVQSQERVIRAQSAGGGVFRNDPNEPTELRI